ncbi:nucleoside 2-deoxyribosyltransferase domain-containing protein [Flavobacterium sp. MC2016-06]|uniref:nucleoside 2-deoxyribosyltransferase domain-containing protein n=1 Tax=Flavobacterium sp. MC2016-06 TaxID=2676308 RepID=UPI0012BAAB3B|nr:nucleoside 2-deoxyribosyltransferase domain-containing protein [Flavobacterium sp. MC2016-06]MBU3860053.1 nucleoside 2-deoxyribosyltransferase domain-containing protein [Flavobacterium sp. MC2016-06]
MKVIYPTNAIETQGIKIFLAGTIDMGNSIDWQQKVIDDFQDFKTAKEIIILNPRRKDWDSSWTQTIENEQFNGQVNWELDALEKSDFIIMFLDKNSKSPISMLELGLFADSKKILVCCEEGFWRKGNIDIVCKRKEIPAFKTLEDLITALKSKINSNEI